MKLVILLIVVVVLGCVLFYNHYSVNVYPIDKAMGYLARAEATGLADEMIEYIDKAMQYLEKYSGNPAWIFPTSKTDFDMIKKDLEKIRERLEILKTLDVKSDAYQQGLDDVRGKIRVIIACLDECEVWVLFSPLSVAIAIAWIIIVGAIILKMIW